MRRPCASSLLCTGDELVTGLIADTNSPYLEARLFELGLKVQRGWCWWATCARTSSARLREAAARADVVLVSGGLGPTADDFTAECAAQAAGRAAGRGRPGARGTSASASARRGRRADAQHRPQALGCPRAPRWCSTPWAAAPMFIAAARRLPALLRARGAPRVPGAGGRRGAAAACDAQLEARPAAHPPRLPAAAHAWACPSPLLDARVAPLRRARTRGCMFGFRTARAGEPAQADGGGAHPGRGRARRWPPPRPPPERMLGRAVFGADGETLRARSLARLLTAAAGHARGGRELHRRALIARSSPRCRGERASFIGGAVVYTEADEDGLGRRCRAELLAAPRGGVEPEVALAHGRGHPRRLRDDLRARP